MANGVGAAGAFGAQEPPEVSSAVVAAYAKEHGVGEQRASTALATQAKGAGLTEALRSALGSDYGQLWFAEGRYVVYAATAEAAERARELLAERELATASEVRVVAWNAGDLDRALRATAKELSPVAGDARAAIVQGGIEVQVSPSVDAATRANATDAARQEAGAFDVPVTTVRAASELTEAAPEYALPGYRSNGTEPLIGGMEYYNTRSSCTLAFLATAVGNYYLTAGHCLAAPNTTENACTVGAGCTGVMHDIGGYVNSAGDAGVLAAKYIWASYPAALDWTSPWQTFGVRGVATSVGGEFYCKTGAGSHRAGHSATTCATNTGVVAVQYPREYPGLTLYLQRAQGNICSFPGDSGGPYWNPATANAIGIHSGSMTPQGNGGCGTLIEVYYTDAGPAAAALGVSVARI